MVLLIENLVISVVCDVLVSFFMWYVRYAFYLVFTILSVFTFYINCVCDE